MMKEKKFRRRADDDDDADVEDSIKVVVNAVSEKSGKDRGKDKPGSKASVLLSFAEDEEYAGGKELKSSSVTLKSKKDRSKGRVGARAGEASSLLSFDGDDGFSNGAVVVKTKKKSGFGVDKASGQRPGFGRDKALGNSSTPSSVQPQPGEYTKEKLAELQRNTIRLGVPMPVANNKPVEPKVVLKGLVKPPGATNGSLSETVDSKDVAKVDSVLGLSGGGIEKGRDRDDRDPRKRVDDAESRLGLMGIGANAESTGITHIPDAAAIAAAKAMRERLRQAQAAPDYISLATGDGAELRSKLREPALGREQNDDVVREEDESSGDEGEVQGRLAFLGEKPTGQKSRAGVFEAVEERVTDERPVEEQRDDEEDEERRWEEEQLRKGVGKRVDDPARVTAMSTGPSQIVPAAFNVPSQVAPTAGAGWGFGRNLEKLSVQHQADAAKRTLQEGLQRLRDSHARTEADLYRTEESLSLSLQTVGALEEAMTSTEEKYLYMQELREHISVLCDFLKDKAPIIEMLAEHLQGLHDQRANAVTERRHGDSLDQQAEIDAAVGAAKEALSRGGGTASAATAASAALSAFSAREGSNLAPQLDEFGRDVNLQQRMESKRRAQARARRAAQSSSRQMASIASSNGVGAGNQRVEGESSSEESESEGTGYESQREKVVDTAGRTLGDAAEEFAQLHKVKERLEKWKLQYPAAYRDAYVSLSAPALFAPYVRLELLGWDPLYSDSSFTSMNWYKELSEYGMPQNSKALEANDVDNDLVPHLVEKVAIPILHHEVERCWDPLSFRGTRRIVAATEDVVAHVSASNEALLGVLSAVHTRLDDAVSALDVPVWSYQIIAAVPQAARMSAQKFGRSLRLLRNIGTWKNVIPTTQLEKLALDDLLSTKILPHLRTLLTTLHDAVTRTERVIAALAGVWLGSSQESRPKLSSLVEFVIALTRALEKRRDSAGSVEDGVGLARRVKRILVDLNEYDRAHQLSKYFQLKEAL